MYRILKIREQKCVIELKKKSLKEVMYQKL